MWEYAEDFAKQENGWHDLLNKYGEDGWELVAVVPDDDQDFRLIFKRPTESSDG